MPHRRTLGTVVVTLGAAAGAAAVTYANKMYGQHGGAWDWGSVDVALSALSDAVLHTRTGAAIQALVVTVVVLYCGLQLAIRPRYHKSKDYHHSKSKTLRRLRAKSFFPAYSNGWHAVCNAQDIADNQVKSISALGRNLVAFRGEDGKAGVLNAFCPHLGAHLGEGGRVDGNLLVCPFHSWAFDATGACRRIPYMKGDPCNPPPRTRTKAYPVREMWGLILVWLHAEEDCADRPAYEPEVGADLDENLKDGSWYFAKMRTMEFEMHSCEMAMNSADQVHFDTLHSPLPIPFLNRFIHGIHRIGVNYCKGIIRGQVVDRKELTLFKEKTQGFYFFGNTKWPVPTTEASSQAVDTTVIFEGPAIVHFIIDTPAGRIRQVMTLLSVEPFKQYVESRWYAEAKVPRWVVNLIGYIGANALEQDRQVWENKIFRKTPTWVPGDGPFPAFIRWYGQFYSERSRALQEDAYEW